MRKLLGAALSLVLVYGTVGVAQAEILKNLKTSGEVEVQAVGSTNLTDFTGTANDKDGRATTRVLLNGMFDLSDEASATVSVFKNDRTYGAAGNASQSVTAVQGVVAFSQANVTLKNVMGIDQKLGRQYYGNPGDLVIYFGPSRTPFVRTLPVTALDAWTGWWSGDKESAHAVVGKLADTAGPGETDVDLRGVEVNSTRFGDMANLRLQLYNQLTHTTALNPSAMTTIIAPKVSGKAMDGNLNYSAEITYNKGSHDGTAANCSAGTANCGTSGYSGLVNASYGFSFMGTLKVMGEFGYGSGVDPNSLSGSDKTAMYIASDYRPGDIWGGNVGVLGSATAFTNAAGLNNLTTFNVGFWHTWDRWSKLSWGAQYYNFMLTKQASVANSDKGIGSEVDLRARWQNSENVGINVGVGEFLPGKLIKDAVASSNNIVQYYANFDVRF